MTRAQKYLALVAAGLLGAWGCGQSPSGTTSSNAATGSKVAKLEADLKAAESARDAARTQAAQADEKLAKEAARAAAAEKDREEIKTQLKIKAAERESLQVQLDTFKKGLKDLLGQMEPSTPGVTTTSTATGAMGATVAIPQRSGF